ncbi:MAG: isoprenylcysteine carboxylmethyltransferase family protein [Coriobacteriia bacterium]|nr:isoprenylcysteine carboxylmethyltransferase family protein [Coriobacteriia bacterium]
MLIIYILAYVVFAGFFVVERFVRRGKDTKNMDRTEHDRGSTTFISAVMGAAIILVPCSPLLNWLGIGSFHLMWLSIVGLLLGVAGLIIRYSAFTTLGRFFSRTLREAEDHTLITSGIYHFIRHPGYLSDLLIFIGLALAMSNLITLIVIVVTFVAAYTYRIRVEERMLIEIFGERYREYQKHSKRLIPFIF